MKLAEALQERADINRRIESLRSRLNANAIVQEGEKTPEDPMELLAELNRCTDRLEDLIKRINIINSLTIVDGTSITALIAKKDVLTAKIGVYRDFLGCASNVAQRAKRTEIKILSTVDVSSLQKEIDKMSRDLRLIDNKIQAANWATAFSDEDDEI